MFFSVLLCLLVTFLNLVGHIRAHAVARYECGPHGTFEYCVDKIPGCVIGCHCHPGYYFDTETKICEPNSKLTDDYRRRFLGDANLIYPVNTPRLIQNFPTQTTTSNVIEEGIEEISKDTDDIGDWLYNQFFKAVESQVINNSSDETPLTRRSGNGGKLKAESKLKGDHKKNNGGRKDVEWEPKHKTKRKTRKFLKGKGKKSKSKVHGLRRKLLRITEDDSLFDSESDDDSRGGGSDTSSSGSSESSSSSSTEGRDKETDNRDHGHKKVIIFNRRPRPPLPSFIFLPSMDTPYYPPIGLPPPPIMPMYPMVPVPPMAPFIPVLDNKKDCTGSTTPHHTPNTNSEKDSIKDVKKDDNKAPEGNHVINPEPESIKDDKNDDKKTPTISPETESNKDVKHDDKNTPEIHSEKEPIIDDKKPPVINTETEAPEVHSDVKDEHEITPDKNNNARTKMLKGNRRTKSKMHKSKRPVPLPRYEERISMRSGGSEPRMSLTPKQSERIKLLQKLKETLETHNNKKTVQSNEEVFENTDFIELPEYKPQQNQKEVDDSLKDVNFKYLTELIHRQKLDDPALNNNNTMKQLQLSPPSRRNYGEVPIINYGNEITTSTSLDPNDAIYMNLGRQIASIIRDTNDKIHSNIARKPTETNSLQDSINSILNEKSSAPRSYWERFVRSPLNRLKTYLRELHLYKQSNEKDLLTLENQLQTVASTVPPLSLQDLENMLTAVQKTFTEINKGNKFAKQSNTSLNVNLLPNKLIKEEILSRRMNRPSDNTQHIQLGNITAVYHQKEPISNEIQGLQPTNNDELMMDDWIFTARKLTPINKFYQQSVDKPTRHNYLLLSNTSLKPSLSNNKTSENSEKQYLKFVKMPVPIVSKPEQPSAYFDFLAQYPRKPTRYPKLPTKDAELPIKKLELPAKYPEQSVKYPELPTKYSEQRTKYPERFLKYSEQSKKQPTLSAKYPEPSVKYPKSSAVYQEPSAKYPEPSSQYPKPSAIYIYREPSAKDPKPSAKYQKSSAIYQEPSAKYLEPSIKYPKPSAIYQEPSAKYPKPSAEYPESLAKYHELSAKYPEPSAKYHEQSKKYLDQYSNVKAPMKIPEQAASIPKLTVKYSDLSTKPDKPVDQTVNFGELPSKYVEISAKYPEQPAKYPELNENFPDIPEKYIKHSAKYPELLIKYPEVSDNLPELPEKQIDKSAKYFELPATYPGLLAEFSELSRKTPELPTKYSDIPSKYKDIMESSPEILVKHSDLSAKYPEVSTKDTEVPLNDFEQAVNYHDPLVKQNVLQGKPAPAIINYKSLNYFSGAGNKRHYLFRASYPGYKKIGSNSEGQKPSYFHHEFHHFDYFE